MRKFSKEATAEEQQLDTYEADDVGYAMRILNNARTINAGALTNQSVFHATRHSYIKHV